MLKAILWTGIGMASLLGGAAQAQGPNQYLCITDQAAGVRWFPETKTWGSTIFTVGEKWVLRHLKGDERQAKYPDNGPQGYTIWEPQARHISQSEWGFFAFGERIPRTTCDASFDCTTDGLSLHFNPKTGRFETSQLSGYTYTPLFEQPGFMGNTPEDEKRRLNAVNHPDTGSITIGKCVGF